MSVDYKYCEACNECIYDEYVPSCKCGMDVCKWCLEGYAEDNDDFPTTEDVDGEGIYKEPEEWLWVACPFCMGDMATDGHLLEILMKDMDITREDLLKEYKKRTKGGLDGCSTICKGDCTEKDT